MRKKATLLTVLTVFLLTTTAFAAIDADAAQEKAARLIPAGAKHLYTKTGNLEYGVQFVNDNTNTHYEVKISRTTGAITESKTRIRGNPGSNNIKLSEQQAKDIVLKEYPNAIIKSVKLETDSGYKHYQLEFTAGRIHGNYEINPESGIVIEKELQYLISQ